MERGEAYLRDQPGLAQPLATKGASPQAGSCLLYGDSGVPTRRGPLAPDKIVFRDGWSPESRYVLLNLRFTGWHRYKATNTLTAFYQRGPLAVESDLREAVWWLPAGRSDFRDKRIPREALNGLLISRSGMAEVLYRLSGLGGPWAQDPPHYAHVIGFETGSQVDWAHTRLTDWRGWQHDRWVHFHHGSGPLVLIDQASGPPGERAAVAWHLNSAEKVGDWRILLREGDERGAMPAEVLFVPVGARGQLEVTGDPDGGPMSSVLYHGPENGDLRLATVYLLGDWTGAEAGLDEHGQTLWIRREEHRIEVPLEDES
jgi:hypothetical protein